MKRLFRFLHINVRILALSLLFLVALYVVIARSLLAFVPEYRADLQQLLTDALGTPVHIGQLEGQWIGFDPVVVISDLSLDDPDLAVIREVRVRLAVLRSLAARAPRLRSVQIEQTRLTIDHQLNAQGEHRWLVGGVEFSTGGSSDSVELDQLLAVFDGAQIIFADTRLTFSDTQARQSLWRLPDIAAYYAGDELNARGSLLEPGGVQSLMRFALKAELDENSVLAGTLFTEFRSGADLASLFNNYRWNGLRIQEVDASGRLWVDFHGLALLGLHASVQMSELQWLQNEVSLPPLQNLVVEASWQPEAGRDSVHFSQLGFEWLNLDCGLSEGKSVWNQDTAHIYLDGLNVACATELLLALNVSSPGLQERLEVSEPQGHLRHLNVVVDDDTWRFDAELDRVGLKAYESTPAGSNIDGYVWADAEGGGVIFDSDNFELAFPTLFLEPWRTERGQGAVLWELAGEEVDVFSQGIRLRMPNSALVYGDFALRLNGPAHEDTLMLQIALQDIPFGRVPAYVPYYAVGHDLHNWLGDALVSGTAASGIYVGYGSVEVQSAPNSFTSSIAVNTAQGELRFDPEWPHLKGLNAAVFLQNDALSVTAPTAKIAGSTLTNVVAQSGEHNAADSSLLAVRAQTKVAPKDIRYWLEESPIAAETQAVSSQIEVKGELATQIELAIPLSDEAELAYDVIATLDDASVTHIPTRLAFSGVTGDVRVSSAQGVVAEGVQARLFEQDVRLGIDTDFAAFNARREEVVFQERVYLQERVVVERVVPDTRATTTLRLDGSASIAAIAKHLDGSAPPGLRGQLAYTSRLTLPPSGDPVFRLTSQSLGITRDWPVPLRKDADEAEALAIRVDIGEPELTLEATLATASGRQLGTRLRFIESGFERGWIGLGASSLQIPRSLSAGLAIEAEANMVQLKPWLAFIERWQQGAQSDVGRDLINQVSLRIAELEVDEGQVLTQQSVVMTPEEAAWRLDLSGPQLAGEITLRNDGQFIEANLDTLVLTTLAAAEGEERAADAVYDPRELPRVRFQTKSLTLDEYKLGSLAFDLAPHQEGARFADIAWRAQGVQASGQLNWTHAEGQDNSILTLALKGSDIDAVAKQMGWQSPLTSKSIEGELAWVWPDSPDRFDKGELSGTLQLSMRDGRMKTADEKTGALRLFGIFNAETIGRRLKLDFSDLYKSGVSYDSLDLKASIDRGILSIEDKLVIDGPSSKYEVRGKADLANERLDMQMKVELPVAQNVPLAALLLGAPQIGGAVWLIDKILGEPLSQITTASYVIRGPWKNPTLELKKVLNAK